MIMRIQDILVLMMVSELISLQIVVTHGTQFMEQVVQVCKLYLMWVALGILPVEVGKKIL